MAINTAKKRKSISGIPFPYAPGVTPTAEKDQDWRFSAAGSYAGGFVYGINTAAKRRAAAGVAFLPLGPGVTPNSAKNAAWRRQACWSYLPVPILSVARSARSVHKTERPRIHRTE